MNQWPRLSLTITAQKARVLVEFGNRLYQEEKDFHRAREHQRLAEKLKQEVLEETGHTLEDLSPEEILGPMAYDVYAQLWRAG